MRSRRSGANPGRMALSTSACRDRRAAQRRRNLDAYRQSLGLQKRLATSLSAVITLTVGKPEARSLGSKRRRPAPIGAVLCQFSLSANPVQDSEMSTVGLWFLGSIRSRSSRGDFHELTILVPANPALAVFVWRNAATGGNRRFSSVAWASRLVNGYAFARFFDEVI